MVLARLREYERRKREEEGGGLPQGYQERPIRWVLSLDGQGRPVGGSLWAALKPRSGGRGRGDRGLPHAVPAIRRTSETNPCLLADSAEYVLGLPKGETDLDLRRARERFEAFKALARDCAEKTGDRAVQAVLRFLESLDPERARQELGGQVRPDDLMTFEVDEEMVVDRPAVRGFWARHWEGQMRRTRRAQRSGEAEAMVGQCLVCGQDDRPIAQKHPDIPGLPGGRVPLVSFNEPAFWSYGLAQSHNAPVCVSCAEEYARGLGRLLTSRETSFREGDLTFAFWTRDPEPDFPAVDLLAQPEPQEVRRLLEAVYRGGRARYTVQGVQPNLFFCALLSRHQGRAVLRDWLEVPVEDAKENLARFFRLQRLWGQETYFGIRALLRSLRPERRRPRSPEEEERDHATASALARLVWKGQALPEWVLAQAVLRNRAEQGVTAPRAVLIKLALLGNLAPQQQDSLKEGEMPEETYKSPAFLCGRLLALLEGIQQSAVNPRATLVDRFYGGASTSPASVFGLLLRNAQAHLAKLRREKPGLHTFFQRELEEVLTAIGPTFPWTLSLKEQGEFALGYYYQRARRRTAGAPAEGPEEGADTPETQNT